MSAVKERQNPTKKRSLCVADEHFEEDFNAVLPDALGFQLPANATWAIYSEAYRNKT
jgi:hypothetical protein